MSKFVEKLQYQKIYDADLLDAELNDFLTMREKGIALIKEFILEQNLETSKIEFGVLNGYFYIQVIVKTFSTKKWQVDTDFVKFSYKIKENKLHFNSELNKQIFDFYYTKIFQFLNICNLEY